MARRETGSVTVKRVRPRTCIGCGTESPKKGLVRIVRSPEGNFSVDATGRAPGRGAYICPNLKCLQEARRKKALSKCLRIEIPPAFYDEITTYLENLAAREEKG
jgi:predicted RNA-binding protein YlxR (DUF448 family)